MPGGVLVTALDSRLGEACGDFRAGPNSVVQHAGDVWKTLRHDDTRHTLALGGVGLNERQVRAVLDDGIVRDGRLSDYAAAVGYASAVGWVHEQFDGPPPSAQDVASLSERSRGVVDRLSGEYTPPSLPALESAAAAVAEVAAPTPTVSSLGLAEGRCREALAGVAGDIALTRLVVNLALVRSGLPPVVVHARDAVAYHRLVAEGASNDFAGLGVFLARRLLDSLHRFALTNQRTHLVSLSTLADESVSADALRVAAVRGRLRAHKGADGVWRSRRRWVDEYLTTRYVRRPDVSQ